MNRCGIELANGLIRIGVLCGNCLHLAVKKQTREDRRFWCRPLDGDGECEACGELAEGVA